MARRSRPDPASAARLPHEDRARASVGSRPVSWLVGLLVVAALALRLWGIGWGLPNQQRLFSYHPDEGVNLVSGVLENGQPRPHLRIFWNYGGLYFYLWQAAVAVNRTYGVVRQPATGAPGEPASDSVAALILVGRLLTALLGALTVWPIYALGRRLYGQAAGGIAAAVYAVLPAAVVHGHYATVDVPAALFVAAALAAGAALLPGPDRRPPGPLLPLVGGVLCGLAAATKYTCALVILAPLAALLLAGREPGASRRIWVDGALVLAGAVTGFIVGCAGMLLPGSGFWHDLAGEMAKSREGMGLLFADTGNGWVYHIRSSLWFGMGVPMLLLAGVAVAVAVARRSRADWYLLAFLLPYYGLIGYAQVRYLRYIIPMLPVLAILIGRLLADPSRDRPALARALAGLGVLAGALTALLALAYVHLMTLPDARDQAAAAIDATVPAGRSIAFATTPWYYSPPLSPLFTAPSPQARRQGARELTRYALRLPAAGTEWDPRVLDAPPADCVVVSDIETEDPVRLRYPPALAFLDRVRSGYTARVFQSTPNALGVDFGKPAYVPNDWLYIYPRITLYTRG